MKSLAMTVHKQDKNTILSLLKGSLKNNQLQADTSY